MFIFGHLKVQKFEWAWASEYIQQSADFYDNRVYSVYQHA